ncbi:hypothetical protein IT398_00820 [Candidatus Nomurabacteria bacterium]|nr:hypothetical protein [Candidatus Nomurabacteria bacterium]
MLKRFLSLEDFKLFLSSLTIVSLFFSAVVVGGQAYAATQTTTLTVTVNTALTFAIDNNAGNTAFPAIDPGTPVMATTTLQVTTNDVNGWTVALAGDDQGTSNTVMDLTTDASVGLTDQTEWVPGTATTSVGNAVQIGSLDNSGDVLAFRVMSASGSVPFRSTSWWGSQDNYLTDSANTLWAGIASSTVSRNIGNAGAGSYSSSVHLNTVQYYLDVPASQQSGSYTGALTYTATAN